MEDINIAAIEGTIKNLYREELLKLRSEREKLTNAMKEYPNKNDKEYNEFLNKFKENSYTINEIDKKSKEFSQSPHKYKSIVQSLLSIRNHRKGAVEEKYSKIEKENRGGKNKRKTKKRHKYSSKSKKRIKKYKTFIYKNVYL